MILASTPRLLALILCLLQAPAAVAADLLAERDGSRAGPATAPSPTFAINPPNAPPAPAQTPLPSPFQKSFYESRLQVLEQQVRMGCHGNFTGEGRAFLNYRTMERAWRLTDEVRKRADAIFTFIDDPQRSSREARAADLDRRMSELRMRIADAARSATSREGVHAMVAELRSLETARGTPVDEFSPASPSSARLQRRAQTDLESLATVLARLDAVAARANSCYSLACNLAGGSVLAICGENARMRQIEGASAVTSAASLGLSSAVAR